MNGDAPQPPFRIAFDNARDPYTARNALGIPEPAAAPDLTIYALKSDFPAGAWTAWSPTISSGLGTIASSTVTTARYTQAGKTITAFFDITVTNQGTGAGSLLVSLPVPMHASGGGCAVGVEINIIGCQVVGIIHNTISTTEAFLQVYDGTSIVLTGVRVVGTMTYESA